MNLLKWFCGLILLNWFKFIDPTKSIYEMDYNKIEFWQSDSASLKLIQSKFSKHSVKECVSLVLIEALVM